MLSLYIFARKMIHSIHIMINFEVHNVKTGLKILLVVVMAKEGLVGNCPPKPFLCYNTDTTVLLCCLLVDVIPNARLWGDLRDIPFKRILGDDRKI